MDFLNKIISPLMGAANIVVDIKTQITPDIHLDIQKIIDSPTNPILKIAKPRITLSGAGLNQTLAPFGEPTKNYFPVVIMIILLISMLIFYAGYRVGER